MTAKTDISTPPTPPLSAVRSDALFSIAREYGEAGLHLEFRPHGYPFPIVLPVITSGARAGTKAWTWNGSTENPTLRPSVKTHHPDGTMSHIWLNDGMCQHLGDSTDGLAGQTLPLIPLENDQAQPPRTERVKQPEP